MLGNFQEISGNTDKSPEVTTRIIFIPTCWYCWEPC